MSDLETHDLKSFEKVLVIIPALDEAATIGGVIQALQAQGLRNICVVDNGSCDSTAAIAAKAKATVLYEPKNGYGQACWRGMQAMDASVEWVLFCDADGSDDLTQLPLLLAQRHDYDLILGNRRSTQAGQAQLTWAQNFGNGLATRLIKWGWHHTYQDLGPFRLIRRAALDQIQMCDRAYGWTVEMQTRAIECGLRIREIPVDYHPRQGGQSKISGTLKGACLAGFYILTTLAKLYWKKLERPFHHPGWGNFCLFLSVVFILLGSVWILPYGDFRAPNAVPNFWIGIALMSIGFILSWALKQITRPWFWGVTIASRLLLLTMYPGDDIWRYLWEGYIQTFGFSPYDQPPNAEILSALRTNWWTKINNEDISAIYPPITQLGFRWIAQVHLSVLTFKGLFTLADLGVCAALSRHFGYRATLLYAWNPLIIYSFAGGGHYDSWFMLPLVVAWLWFERGLHRPNLRYLGSALLLGISIAVKWITLPMLGFLLWRCLREKRWALIGGILALGLGPLVLSALPFCSLQSCPLVPLSSNFVTEGRSADLIPYLVTLVWPASRWQNHLFAFPLLLGVLILWMRSPSFLRFSEGYLIVLLLLSPVIHAWYFCWLVPFAVASRNLGTRWVSLSVFIYFVLQLNLARGEVHWLLSNVQRGFLWIPFLLGLGLWMPKMPHFSTDQTALK